MEIQGCCVVTNGNSDTTNTWHFSLDPINPCFYNELFMILRNIVQWKIYSSFHTHTEYTLCHNWYHFKVELCSLVVSLMKRDDWIRQLHGHWYKQTGAKNSNAVQLWILVYYKAIAFSHKKYFYVDHTIHNTVHVHGVYINTK